jgi:hypothetical protein
MNTTILLLALLSQNPAAAKVATAPATAQAPKRSACEYTSDDPAKKGLAFCANVATEEACKAEAARKVPAAWLEKHPAKFKAGVDCKASDKKLAKAEKKKQQQKQQKPAPAQ